ncbi:MAG: ABC transporter ATP-binding protein [Rhodospirillaceae bacterium]|jgi:putative hydroxymethylpyrimidine transport system ATP-binding protein|nr:ABC transporter ATP-binding protein [Rhodospirillaceae bacterium]
MTIQTEPISPAPGTRLGIRLDGIALALGGTMLFEDLELHLLGGLTTCLLGPSGVGKSSLLRLLAGLGPTPTAGSLSCDDGRPLAGRTAYMDQRDLLLPWLSGHDNVTLGARLRGETPDRARADELLARVGLGDRHQDRPATLSGGMRQRLALARTLMEDRPIVLMDEPFSSLDVLTRLLLQDLAAELLAERTVLLVTHDPMEALRLGHRIFVMSGSPALLGAPLEPAGAPPRDAAQVSRSDAYRDLLARLGVGGSP